MTAHLGRNSGCVDWAKELAMIRNADWTRQTTLAPAKEQYDDLVMALVHVTLAQPKEEREQYLRGGCAQGLEFFKEVWKYVEWEERMNGFLLDPLYLEPSSVVAFEPSELLDNRFRIVREVAHGGMGVVYEAVDEKLGRRIAIKCAKPGFRRWLPPEVRHASEITHPSVCRIFEIHTVSTDHGRSIFSRWSFWRVRRWPSGSTAAQYRGSRHKSLPSNFAE